MSVIEEAGPDGQAVVGSDRDTFDRYARLVRTTLNVPIGLVTIVEPDRQVFVGAQGLPEPLATTRETTLSRSYCRHVVADREPLFAPDVREEPRLRDNPLIHEHDVVAYAGWPLRDHEHRVVGSLCALAMERRDWTADQRDMLADLAAACSAEIAQRGLRAEALADEARARHLSNRSRALLTLSEMLSGTRTLLDVARALEQTAREQLGCAHASIWVRETDPEAPPAGPLPRLNGPPERLVRVVPAPGADGEQASELPLDDTNPLGRCLLDQAPAYLADRDTLLQRYPRLRGHDAPGESYAWLPMMVRGQAFGVLLLAWPEPGALSDEGRITIAALTSYTAQAVHRARLLEDRLDALVTLQSSMTGRLPDAPGLALAARYLPAAKRDQVGGDWYDAVVMADGCTAVLVGDVVGHDMEAAAAMGQLRSMLRTLAWAIGDAPAATVQRLDHAIADLGVDAMATLLYVHLEPPDEPGGATSMLWSSAGHPPPLLIDPGGSAWFAEGDPDLLLGVRPTATRSHHRLRLEPGTTVVLYTDGLIERRGENLSAGLDRLRAAAEEHAHLPVPTLLDSLRGDLLRGTSDDDVALLAARLDGPAG